MQCNGVQSGAINAMNAIIAKLISLYKQRSYGQRLEMPQTDHTREVTGSSPVSPTTALRIASQGLVLSRKSRFDQLCAALCELLPHPPAPYFAPPAPAILQHRFSGHQNRFLLIPQRPPTSLRPSPIRIREGYL